MCAPLLEVKLITFWPHSSLDLPTLREKHSCKIKENKIWVSFLNTEALPRLRVFFRKFALVIGHNFGSSVTHTYPERGELKEVTLT